MSTSTTVRGSPVLVQPEAADDVAAALAVAAWMRRWTAPSSWLGPNGSVSTSSPAVSTLVVAPAGMW